ncbi:DUF1285 domain-containing protein [Marinobacterium sediminicola]|uniref:DUF1285 domain-containing protein n=1 Tax=Marinobacterium sediminicola TaxID=518898 RepID=A0ABY1S3F2_9GAMM|nr:DUF1285 domain-containing protein [Marinobacterium sediminicola]ULG68225.1 DUF1285 domain-containing protein [Marinobacterium sediminicola]SMR77807.1 hypothetical protein SAMN04487964_11760 [Marinobacterium sediminicola]
MSGSFDPAALGQQLKGQEGIPPLEKWNPEFCGDIDMRIARDGRWYYQGSPIGREAMVKMFSRVLWKEGDQYFLKTPVEKVGIQVDDVPFQVVDVEHAKGEQGVELIFTTSTGDRVRADAEHPIRVEIDPETKEPSPYLMIRFGMEGLIGRNLFYQLVELARMVKHKHGTELVVDSAGETFSLGEL